MFHFKRRTLWIIIYLTIPLIIVLNSLGPDPETEPESPLLSWSLDNVQPDCETQICTLILPGSRELRVTAIVGAIPTANVPLPESLTLRTQFQGGRMLAEFKLPASGADTALIAFLQQWLPADTEALIISGAEPAALAHQLANRLGDYRAASADIRFEPPTALGLLRSPPFGSAEQLAFLLWVDVLQSRLAGYEISVRWDHRRAESVVLFNSSLGADLFYPVTETEFQAVLAPYLKAAAQRQRPADQIHRYASIATLYQLPFSFFVDQPQRLAALDLDAINQMRDFALGQIRP